MKHFFLIFFFILNSLFLCAQTPITKNIDLPAQVPVPIQVKLLNALDTLLVRINQGRVDTNDVNSTGYKVSLSVFNTFKGIENNEKKQDKHYYKPQLINLYPIQGSQYFISLAYIGAIAGGNSLRAIIDFVAIIDNDKVTFSVPFYYLTRNWKITKTGNITYYYPDNINLARAKKFDQNNSRIATKLGLQPEQFDFYLCDNYQDILHLVGYEYDSESAGIINESYGVEGNIIFSVMHNEDFSHDTFHYYASKIRTGVRNSAAEEGIAYSWGNAYYADEHGEMITQKKMVKLLKAYLQLHPQTSLFELFSKNPSVFNLQFKVRSVISSLICDEVERSKGIAGIKALIDCGRGDDNFFTIVNEAIGINTTNFDARVMDLLAKYN